MVDCLDYLALIKSVNVLTFHQKRFVCLRAQNLVFVQSFNTTTLVVV